MSAILVLCSLIYLPIIFNFSHATDFLEFVPMMPMAAIASATDSLMIKVYPIPAKALSDRSEPLTLEGFEQLLMQ
jgi:3-deoxy-7-phosphoheptulonate synthase